MTLRTSTPQKNLRCCYITTQMSGQDLVPNEPHALHGMTIDLSDDGAAGDPATAAAIDLTADSSSDEEEDTLAHVVCELRPTNNSRGLDQIETQLCG